MGDEVASRYCIVHLLCCRNGAFASLVREIDGNIPSLARDLASAIMHCAHAVDKSVCSACAERLHEPLRDVPIWLPAGDPRKAFRHLESALRNARSATGASVGLSVEKLFAFPVEKMPSAVGGKALTEPQDFSRLAKEPGKGAVECATTVHRETVDSGSTHGAAEHASVDRRGLSWKAGKPSIHGHHGV